MRFRIPDSFARGLAALLLAPVLCPAGASARDSLGIFGSWAAFRDPDVPRCYAIARPDSVWPDAKSFQPYADISDWPKRAIRGAVHFRLARPLKPAAPIVLNLGGQRFRLIGSGADAWSADSRMDAAIVAALRSAPGMTLHARDSAGHPFTATWQLAGAATAMDSALLGCAGAR